MSENMGQGFVWPEGQLLPSFSPPAAKLDVLDVTSALHSEKTLFATLKGLINRSRPRIVTYEEKTFSKHEWLDKLNLGYTDVSDNWSMLQKYKSEINGIVIYDPDQSDTLNLATVIAGIDNGIVAHPELVDRLTSAPYFLDILEDLRGRFTSNVEVYQYAYDNYWPHVTHRVLVSLSPNTAASVREYSLAIKSMIVWLDPRIPAEDAVLRKFLADMPAGEGLCLGWWAEEQSGVKRGSEYGLATLPSDHSKNLSVYGGTTRIINIKPTPPKPLLQNKVYVTFIMSDGDNLQYMERDLLMRWDDPSRGKVPLGWTMTPMLLDAAPAILDWYYKTATENDCLICGPSGTGYTYPNSWTDRSALEKYLRTSDDYCEKTGLRVITVWNGEWDEISEESARLYADCMPSVLGITSLSKGKGGPLKIYNQRFVSINLAADYYNNAENLKDTIKKHTEAWDGHSPYFIAVQAIAWRLGPTDILGIVDSLDSRFEAVRTDAFFELAVEASNTL